MYLCHTSQALDKDVDVFSEQVDGCVSHRHYKAAQLAKLAATLQEKKTATSCTMGERVRVARGGLGFYKGVEKVG